MKVIDASYDLVRGFCFDIAQENKHGLVGKKTLVVGVASGGTPIAIEFANALGEIGISSDLAKVCCRRPSSNAKKSSVLGFLFSSMLRIIPKRVLNVLRVLEHFILSRKRNPLRVVETDFDEFSEYEAIFIVDDAVDSGYSLSCVFNFLRSKSPVARIYSIAYVVTQKRPVFEPDYYKEREVLVRFPWAADA